MASTFRLEIVTPDRKFFEDDVDMAVIRTTEGDLGILKNHMSIVSPLAIGTVKIKKDGVYTEAAYAGGFVQVRQDKTTIITDSAEWPEEIDIDRAKRAVDRAEDRIRNSHGNEDVLRAQMALDRALNRLKIAKKD